MPAIPLLSTKFYIPTAAAMVARPRLVARFQDTRGEILDLIQTISATRTRT